MKNWQEQPRERRPELRMIERQLPSNEQAEAVLLGTLLSRPYQLEEIVDILRPEDFYHTRHKILYEILVNYYRANGKPADFLVTCDLLENCEDLDGSDLVALMALRDEIWSVDLMQDARLILGTSIQRRSIFASQTLANIGYTIPDPDACRAAVEKLLYDLTSEAAPSGDFTSLEDILADCMNDIEAATKRRGQLSGIPTGFTDLDGMTDGFQRSDFLILAGRPSMGKTALGMGIGYNAAKRGNAVAVFSLEMAKDQLGLRLLAHVSGVSTSRQRAGWVDDDEMDKLVEAHTVLAELPIHIDDTAGSPISSIRSKLRRLRAKIHRPIDLVVVDYLQLMEDEDDSPGKRENRNQEISRISRGLKGIAREFNVPVLALAQLSRAVETRQSKIPQLSDLRESGSLEQDADVVMFIYRDEMYNPESEEHGVARIILAKHRNGPVGQIFLQWSGAQTRFDNEEGA